MRNVGRAHFDHRQIQIDDHGEAFEVSRRRDHRDARIPRMVPDASEFFQRQFVLLEYGQISRARGDEGLGDEALELDHVGGAAMRGVHQFFRYFDIAIMIDFAFGDYCNGLAQFSAFRSCVSALTGAGSFGFFDRAAIGFLIHRRDAHAHVFLDGIVVIGRQKVAFRGGKLLQGRGAQITLLVQ